MKKEEAASNSQLLDVWKRFCRNKLAMAGMGIALALALQRDTLAARMSPLSCA